MFRRFLGILISMSFALSLAAAPNSASPQAALSAAQIVDRNVTARGGLQAWRGGQTLSLQGTMGVGGNKRAALSLPRPDSKDMALPRRPAEEVKLPFLMELKRPRKM